MAKKRHYNSEISENKSAVANLPQESVYKPWPKSGEYKDFDLDDTIKGIDEQISKDVAKMKKHLQPEKY